MNDEVTLRERIIQMLTPFLYQTTVEEIVEIAEKIEAYITKEVYLDA